MWINGDQNYFSADFFRNYADSRLFVPPNGGGYARLCTGRPECRPWLTAFAYGTSYFSAVIFVGYAGQFGWRFGIASTWIGIGNALIGSLLAWVLLGRRTRIMSQHLSSATMPEFFGRRYNSRAIKIAASAITFVFLIPYTASLYNGFPACSAWPSAWIIPSA